MLITFSLFCHFLTIVLFFCVCCQVQISVCCHLLTVENYNCVLEGFTILVFIRISSSSSKVASCYNMSDIISWTNAYFLNKNWLNDYSMCCVKGSAWSDEPTENSPPALHFTAHCSAIVLVLWLKTSLLCFSGTSLIHLIGWAKMIIALLCLYLVPCPNVSVALIAISTKLKIHNQCCHIEHIERKKVSFYI